MKLKYRVIERFRGRYSIEAMCEVFEVSRSGYYAWRNRQQKEAKDQWLVDLVVACQRQSKQTYGIRRVRRWIQRRTGKLVNVKAILRVMRKLILCKLQMKREQIRIQCARQRIYPTAACVQYNAGGGGCQGRRQGRRSSERRAQRRADP